MSFGGQNRGVWRTRERGDAGSTALGYARSVLALPKSSNVSEEFSVKYRDWLKRSITLLEERI